MALRIFDTDPDAKPKPKSTDYGYDFQFRSGMQKNRKPISLANWRVLSGRPDVSDAIAQLMGGSVSEWDPSKEMNLEVLTETNSIEIVIDGPDAIEDKLILWGRSGPVHECDGEFFLSPVEDKGKPCGCPKTLKDRKAAARAGRGPSPAINVTFRLAHDYDLGRGKLIATAWSMAEVIHTVKNDLERVGEPALCTLTIEKVEYTNKDGENVSFKKPVIEVLGSYNDAIAEERD
ncbi:hypothetical protein [Streptomyces chattanoogensis]|uniref:hypothetical protein n=1 Tax=Streptomyces chattanoogensis TaxID=66876 RepID=UPI0036AE97B6